MNLNLFKTQNNNSSVKVHALYATGRNGEMGKADGTLPWRTPQNKIRKDLPPEIIKQCEDDMILFKNLTTENVIIMGYNTFKTFSSPLPRRINIVIDRYISETEYVISENIWNFFPSMETAISKCSSTFPGKEIFIIGGSKILHEAFSKNLITGKILHTIIDADFPDATVYYCENNFTKNKIKP